MEFNRIINDDCISGMKELDDCSVDTIITDPPYGLSFMGKKWDYDIPSVEHFNEMFRVLKPGGFLLCFGGARTWHRVAVNIEDSGFEIRDTLCWLYGSGFPKSYDISKGIDKKGGEDIGWFGGWLRDWRKKNNISQRQIAALFPSSSGGLTGCVANWELGLNMPTPEQFSKICKEFNLPFESIEEAEREVVGSKKTNLTVMQNIGQANISGDVNITVPQTEQAKLWDGFGTALKPAFEPIIMAMKPVEKNFVTNALKYGVAGLNINGGRIGNEFLTGQKRGNSVNTDFMSGGYTPERVGRFPSNVILGCDCTINNYYNTKEEYNHDVLHNKDCPIFLLDKQSGVLSDAGKSYLRGVDNFNKIAYGKGIGAKAGTVRHSFGDVGGASRFFYCAKASRSERELGLEGFSLKEGGSMSGGEETRSDRPSNHPMVKNFHPTVKPLSLMRYLCKLTKTPSGGIVLDPFTGSGTTLIAAYLEGRSFIGFEREKEYYDIANARLSYYMSQKKL